MTRWDLPQEGFGVPQYPPDPGQSVLNDYASPQSQQPAIPIIPPPSKKHIDEAKEYVPAWCDESAEYMERKVTFLDLVEDLYYNRRPLDQWGKKQNDNDNRGTNRAGRRRDRDNPLAWHANFTVSCAPFVDGYVQGLQRTIFANAEYFEVKPRPRANSVSIEDQQFSTSKKLQSKILMGCDDLKFVTKSQLFLKDTVMSGTGIAKAIPFESQFEKLEWDPESGAIVPRTIMWRQGTQVRILNPARFLPDPHADSSDVQSWEACGDRTIVPFDVIRARFGSKDRPGPYNIGRAEFDKEWPNDGEHLNTLVAADIKDDKDSYSLTTKGPRTYLMVWERHGLIPFSDTDGPVECVDTIVTSLSAKKASSGVLVRHQERPVLMDTGVRPYLVCPFSPLDGPFGMGLIEANLDVIWILSHLINQLLDAVRFVAMPMVKRTGLAPPFESEQDANVAFPGKVWYTGTPNIDDLQSFILSAPDLQALVAAIQYFEKVLERRTAISDSVRAMGTTRKSATEFAGLQGQAQVSILAVLDSIKENYLTPYGRIALGYLAERTFSDSTVYVPNEKGVAQPVTLTAAEVRSGDYTVVPTLDTQEGAKISKGQLLANLLPALLQVSGPLLQYEDTFLSIKAFLEEIFRLVGTVDISKIMLKATPEQKAAIQASMTPQQTATTPETTPNEEPTPEAVLAYLLQSGAINPNGEEPTAMTELFAQMQANGMLESPVPPGSQFPA